MPEQPLRKMDTLLSLLTIRFEFIIIGGIIYVHRHQNCRCYTVEKNIRWQTINSQCKDIFPDIGSSAE